MPQANESRLHNLDIERRCPFKAEKNVAEHLRVARDGSLARIDTYLLDNATGHAVFVSDKLPMLTGRSGDQVFAFENDPFPRVVFLTLAK